MRTFPYGEPAHGRGKLDFVRRYDLVQVFQHFLGRDSMVVNPRLGHGRSIASRLAVRGQLPCLFSVDLCIESMIILVRMKCSWMG